MTKQTKIFISVVLSCTMLLLLFIPSFALTPSTLLQGRYLFNDVLTTPDFEFVSFTDGQLSVYLEGVVEISGNRFNNPRVDSIEIYEDGLVNYTLKVDDITVFSGDVYSASSGWNLRSELSFETRQTFRNVIVEYPFDTYDELFVEYFENNTSDLPYTGNPFLDFMNGVIEALDVPIFGTFSLWDMLTTVCGLFAVVWLLKLLAGG